MVHLKQMMVFGAIGIVSLATLAGCNSAPPATTAASPRESSSFVAGSTKAGFDELRNVIVNTRGAVEAGDFAKARADFAQFEDFWKQVEDGVKAKSASTYDAIEQSMDQINGELKTSQPNQAIILSALQSLEANVNSVAN
ncbi:hypothetical protein [Thermocoleostomius sinensis]|uniref:DUF4363 domain-containing protein n=1 Tax=Thermocoleostomius sinensis A174 TaxID=2016057 RepID=A0A9E8ZB87_9CYAN|nr:hypothetical protein [Thermocoleostomius sinensis]WAL59953.1 hypothetical protein OXH18_22725 [Thermocoleostomius sinensis A174]